MKPEFKFRGYLLGNLYPETQGVAKRLLRAVFSRKFLQTARFEKQYVALALRRAFGESIFDTKGKDYLNIAPGPESHDGYFNIDAFSYPGLDAVFDCRTRLPFRDGQFRGIFTEHFIEHLDYVDEFGKFLAECHRVMATGGTLRLATPDAEKYFQSYVSASLEKMLEVRNAPAGYYNTRVEIINELFHQGVEHKFIFDGETLAMRCRAAGFSRVEICEFRQGRTPALLIDREVRRGESLYVEATK